MALLFEIFGAVYSGSVLGFIIEITYIFAKILIEHSSKHHLRNFPNHTRILRNSFEKVWQIQMAHAPNPLPPFQRIASTIVLITLIKQP